MTAPVYEKVALIGLGLIASSMFWAMKRGGLAGEVTGYAPAPKRAYPDEDLRLHEGSL